MYVFDTSPLISLFENFYRSRFPSLWERFDRLVADGQIVSTREAMREVADGRVNPHRYLHLSRPATSSRDRR